MSFYDLQIRSLVFYMNKMLDEDCIMRWTKQQHKKKKKNRVSSIAQTTFRENAEVF